MKTNGFVSIIIPVWNSKKYIIETILSCINQTYQNFEIIIWDDFSSDGTYELVIDIFKSNSVIQIYRNAHNLGLVRTFNTAANKASGDWLLNLGHDDLLPKNYLEKILKNIGDNTVLVHTSDIIINQSNRPINGDGSIKSFKSVFPVFFLSTGNFISFIGVLISRKAFLEVGGMSYSENYCSEALLWLNLSKIGKFRFNNKTRSFYRWHSENLSHTLDINDQKRKYENAKLISEITLLKERKHTRQAVKKLLSLYRSLQILRFK